MEHFIGCDAHKKFSVFDRNLKRAFAEIGNLVVINQRRLGGAHVVRLYQRIKRAKNRQKRWSPWRDTWPKQLGGCSLSRKFIASRKTRDWLFRRRTGKRGCQPSPRG